MIFEYDALFGLAKTILTTCMTLLLMFVMSDFKYSRRRIMVIYCAYLAYVGSSSWLLINLLGWVNFLRFMILSITIPAIIITYHVATDHAMQAVFNYATQIDLALILSMTATMFNTAAGGNRATDLLIRLLLFSAVSFLEYRYLRRLFRRAAGCVRKNWTALALIPVCFGLLFVACGLFPLHFTRSAWSLIHVYLAAGVMAVVYVSVFLSMTDIYDLMTAERQNDILAAQIASLQKQSEALSGITEDSDRPVCHCGNPALDGILSFYLNQAKKDGIEVKASLDLPVILPVDVIELAAVFANAIEQAREMMQRLPDDRKKRLELRCLSYPRFILEIAHTQDHPVRLDDAGIPVQKDGRYSVRTQSILAFTNKNDAILDYSVSGGMFYLRILIQKGLD